MVDITVSDFMKGRYNLMIYVGIDIAKLNHFASAISSDGAELMKPFKFSSPSRLLAFAGLDSSVYQSDNYSAKRTRMSKRGSRVLRYALVNATHNVVKNNATFKAYYNAKMAEGRTHYNALGHCAGKLVRVIWKMLTDEVEFNLD